MTFWLIACALIAVIVIFTLLPMMRGKDEGDSLDFARAFYRDREAELRNQLEAGEIDQTAFEAALAEQGRRLLALAKNAPEKTGQASALARRKMAALLMLVVVPVLAIGLYLKLGRPGMPDVPLASRQVAPKDFDIATAIGKIEAHLARNPDDARGFEVVAPVYMKAGRFDDAANAWRRVIALSGETAQRQADLAEALVAAANGVINAEARKALESALKLEPDMPRARYYLALSLEQDGKKDAAVKMLEKLRDDLPESPARLRVAAEIARLTGAPVGSAAEGIAALPERERSQAISGMVDGLESRLMESGGSLEEWLKLIRARLVLDDKARARAAFEKAKIAFKDNPEGLAALDALMAQAR
ncbi:MAG: c-type cytochrome biogenesis protein CcmI [Proteobacteria bacterium]|nr:c-type cytochrome biogenesis protein CcmI [Pseudomonadota bacterium]